jgi:putative membrane protein
LIEIEAAQLANQKAQSSEVRGYATRFIDEHNGMQEKSRQLANRMNLQPELPQQLSGNDFDRAYIKYQVKMHEQAVSLLEKFANSADNSWLKQHFDAGQTGSAESPD